MRVRLARIEGVDLSVFRFDMDTTFAVFFLNADEKVYGRFGGRDGDSAEGRMSRAGLRYAMTQALEAHARVGSSSSERRDPVYLSQFRGGRRFGGCAHCHQAKEVIDADTKRSGEWTERLTWRFPLPDNLGFVLDVDEGDRVKQVAAESSAARAGLQVGDRIERIADLTVNSFADAQLALDDAPSTGSVEVVWRRGERQGSGRLTLEEGWRRSDISWRPSLRDMVPYLPLHGSDLSEDDKRSLGLSSDQLAFRQRDPAPDRILALGIRPGDVILGIDGKELKDVDARGFRLHVRQKYLVGDRVTIELLRDGKRQGIPMTLTK